ncbi:MAG: hypothetical protein QF398_00555 [Alphaproteobacteria bacterium]|nr:hypothetical protein [Alphaproteobacteria bacterium]
MESEVEACRSVFRIHSQQTFKQAAGLFAAAHLAPHGGQLEKRVGLVGLASQGFHERRFRRFQAAQAAQAFAPAEGVDGVFRVKRHGLRKQALGFLQALLSKPHHTQAGVAGGAGGMVGEHNLEAAFGHIQGAAGPGAGGSRQVGGQMPGCRRQGFPGQGFGLVEALPADHLDGPGGQIVG